MAWLNVYRQAAAEGLLPIARAQSPQVFDHAPEQFPQHSFFPAGHSIYQQAQVEEILEYAPLRESRIADTLEEDTQPAIQPVQHRTPKHASMRIPCSLPVRTRQAPTGAHIRRHE